MERRLAYILLLCLCGTTFPHLLYGQEEEESAALTHEDNTDAFQENFFEALKQEGIENYDKAINYLLACRELEPDNVVVSYELARNYLANGQAMLSFESALAPVNAEPDNYWYLNILVAAATRQGIATEHFQDRIPYANEALKENLARILYEQEQYRAALALLPELQDSDTAAQLERKIRDSLAKNEAVREAPARRTTENPMEALRAELETLLDAGDFAGLETRAAEAVELFPSFPFFHYLQGLALNKGGKFTESVAVLEEGLNYLLDDPVLEEKMYRALAAAYTGLGNSSRANMYLSKIKSGS